MPTEIDDLPPLHIVEGRYIFKHYGFVDLNTGRKGNYILNVLIQ